MPETMHGISVVEMVLNVKVGDSPVGALNHIYCKAGMVTLPFKLIATPVVSVTEYSVDVTTIPLLDNPTLASAPNSGGTA
jgi:hypothetical protein